MEEKRQTDEDTWLVVDDTTIYEVDVNCCRCLPPEERRLAGLEYTNENNFTK